MVTLILQTPPCIASLASASMQATSTPMVWLLHTTLSQFSSKTIIYRTCLTNRALKKKKKTQAFKEMKRCNTEHAWSKYKRCVTESQSLHFSHSPKDFWSAYNKFSPSKNRFTTDLKHNDNVRKIKQTSSTHPYAQQRHSANHHSNPIHHYLFRRRGTKSALHQALTVSQIKCYDLQQTQYPTMLIFLFKPYWKSLWAGRLLTLLQFLMAVIHLCHRTIAPLTCL